MTTQATRQVQSTPVHPAPPVLDLRGAALRTRRSPVFGPLDGVIDQPLTLVLGDRGSGRTSLLLALGGRMRLTGGSIRTLGYDTARSARTVRSLSAVAGFDPIDRLDGATRVSEVLRERQTWTSPWYRRVGKPSEKAVHAALAPVFGAAPVPVSGELVRDLTEGQDLLLRVSLAMVERPRLLLVDDLDAVKNPAERAQVAARLEALAAAGTAVVVGSADLRDAELLEPSTTAVLTLTR
ncbi:ATP-binding cassette domain-containing protein [Demequina capsici]|uniref:ATP-binding cassette domain-containing protein n=1 Tax=Demequina capsici TaxID=3075620 RepID=A0AA96F981_9MICO|nr:ATP-binding cassette domain-containing protein [Demequina sp. OYTSA14]WNM25839.1 ATP-binding cassette domain-containing protein [Demequina sp. OYTSA14]